MPGAISTNEQKLAKLILFTVLAKLDNGVEKSQLNLVPEQRVCEFDLGLKSSDEALEFRTKFWEALESITGSKIHRLGLDTQDKHFMTQPAHWKVRVHVDELIGFYPNLFNSLLSGAFSDDEKKTLEPRFHLKGAEVDDFEIVTGLMGKDKADQLALKLKSELGNDAIYALESRSAKDRYRVVIPKGVQLIAKAMEAPNQNQSEGKSAQFFQPGSPPVNHPGGASVSTSFKK